MPRVSLRSSPGAVEASAATDVLEAAFQPLDPPAHQAAVGLELRLSRAPGADPATEALQVRPLTGQPGQQVLVLRQLYLEPSLPSLGPPPEDVQDQRGTVQDLDGLKRVLQLPLLVGGQLVVANQGVDALALGQEPQLLELTLPA